MTIVSLWVSVLALLFAAGLLVDWYVGINTDRPYNTLRCMLATALGLLATQFLDLHPLMLLVPLLCATFMLFSIFGYRRK